jgi:ATP-dependent DNA helicase PIF1
MFLTGWNKRLKDFIDVDSMSEYNIDDYRPDADEPMQNQVDDAHLETLNQDQRIAFDTITAAVRDRNSANRIFFLDGSGGTGKTFLYNTILTTLRAEGYRCMAMATSGIAACLLLQGRTAHSSFAIPLKLHDQSTCAIGVRSALADLIRKTDFIVWDEAPMTSRYAVEAVHRTVQDILQDDRPFGGM